MSPLRFSTNFVPFNNKIDAWRDHYGSAFDVTSSSVATGFEASVSTWAFDDFAFSRVAATHLKVARTKYNIRRDPIDHWSIILGQKPSIITDNNGETNIIPAGVPFILSLGQPFISERDSDVRLQLYLPRDSFFCIAELLDSMQARPLDCGVGSMLAQYLALLEMHVEELSGSERIQLSSSVKEMIVSCLMSLGNKHNHTIPSNRITKIEKIRLFILDNLRNPSLDPELIARSVGISRSALYSNFIDKRGVMRYITRMRLRQACAELELGEKSIGLIYNQLCFNNASTFSRSFKREYHVSPKQLRSTGARTIPKRTPSDIVTDFIRFA